MGRQCGKASDSNSVTRNEILLVDVTVTSLDSREVVTVAIFVTYSESVTVLREGGPVGQVVEGARNCRRRDIVGRNINGAGRECTVFGVLSLHLPHR
jgi:hypothetical protein